MKRALIAVLLLAAAVAAAVADSIPGLTTSTVAISSNAAASVLGPDGNLWFIDAKHNAIGKLTVDDGVASYPIPTPNSTPYAIGAGLDGNVWFSEMITPKGKIGRITPDGKVSEFPIPGTLQGGPWRIAAGSDGAIWFLEIIDGVHVGRMAADGSFNEYKAAGAQYVAGLVPAVDGMWLIDPNAGIVMKMHSDGTIAESHALPVTAPYSGAAGVIGPDGSLWFIYGTNAINRISPDGTVTAYGVPTGNANPAGVALGPDGNVWFSEYSANRIGQLIVATADSSGHATINESATFGQKLADIFFMPAAVAGKSSLASAFSRGPAGTPLATDCLPPEGRVREDIGESGNLVRIRFVPPSRCADLGITQPNYTNNSRLGIASELDVNIANYGKDDVTDGVVTFSVFPDVPMSSPPQLNCPTQRVPCSGKPAVCRGMNLPAFKSCTLSLFMKAVPGIDDIVIVGMSTASPLYDQNPANNALTLRIDTRTSSVDTLPADSNTPVITIPVTRGR